MSYNISGLIANTSVPDTISLTWRSVPPQFGAPYTLLSFTVGAYTTNATYTNYSAALNGSNLNTTTSSLTIYTPSVNLLNLAQGVTCAFTVVGNQQYFNPGTGTQVPVQTNTTATNSGTPNIFVPAIACFKTGTTIRCGDGVWRTIESLKKGDEVYTLGYGNVPIQQIAKSVLRQSPENEPTKRMYVCRKEKYPELTEDLYITGAHSILVDKVTREQVEESLKYLDMVYITDVKDHVKARLMACVDERAEVCMETEDVTIYHLCLEHPNPKRNYGVYANGLLVETCPKECMDTLQTCSNCSTM
jgi:hypothetical protein